MLLNPVLNPVFFKINFRWALDDGKENVKGSYDNLKNNIILCI